MLGLNARRLLSGLLAGTLVGGGLLASIALTPAVAGATPSALAPITQIASGGQHTCAIVSNGTVRCFGNRESLQIPSAGEECPGTPHPRRCSTIPLVVRTVAGVLSNVVQLSTGGNDSCALRADSTAWCWGEGSSGQLGNRSTTSSSLAVQVLNADASGPLVGIAEIYVGDGQTCALMLDTSAQCWGAGLQPPFGDNAWLPVTVKNANGTPMTHILEIRVGEGGYGPTCVILDDHMARCWGSNQYGQLGIGTTTDSAVPVTVKNAAGTGPLVDIAELALSRVDGVECARLTGGTVYCWGLNWIGQLGIGTTSGPQTCVNGLACSTLPVQVENSDGSGPLTGAVELGLGFDAACARLGAGTISCWGGNGGGALGDGTTTSRPLPVTVVNGAGTSPLSDVVAIAVGQYQTCARLSNESGTCWGNNLWGQLGDGTATNSTRPVTVNDGGVPILPPPLAPTDVSATPAFEAATVSWTAPVDNGTPILSFKVTALPGGQSTLVNPPLSTATVSGLTGGVNYTFTVHAVSLNGESADSASSPVMAIGPPGAPTSPSSVPRNASAFVQWHPPTNPGSSPVTGYILTPYLGATAQPTIAYGASTTSATLTGLPNGAIFSFTIVAVNDQGSGPPSDGSPTVTVIGIPNQPSPKPVAVSGNNQATLSWTAPAANGSPITSYMVIPYRAGVEQTERIFNGPAATVVITGLVNEQTYTFTVAAINAAGRGFTSDASNPVTVGTPTAPPAPRAAPGAATAATGSLIVSHGASTPNGAMISKYTATCTSSNGGVTRSAIRTGAAALPITVPGLTTKKSYSCVVRATNVHGLGAASTATAPIIVGTPAAPTAVSATKLAAGQLRVAFTPGANNGAAITSYSATCVSSNGGTTKTKVGLVRPLTVIGLTAGKTYTCTVKATNSRGAGPASVASLPKAA